MNFQLIETGYHVYWWTSINGKTCPFSVSAALDVSAGYPRVLTPVIPSYIKHQSSLLQNSIEINSIYNLKYI